MKRILILCARDWMHPGSGRVEQYVHEVFSRIAAQGHYVAWVSRLFRGASRSKDGMGKIEIVDGIQVARLGHWGLYRLMAGMLISRMAHGGKLSSRFDVVIDCVTWRPLSIETVADVPVLPIVFGLGWRVRATDDPPGPVIATTREMRQKLEDIGFPPTHIVNALHANEETSSPETVDQEQAWDRIASLVLATIEIL